MAPKQDDNPPKIYMLQDGNEIPRIVVTPKAQAEIDTNPELAKMIAGIKEAMLNAMQGAQDGRYSSFEDALEQMTGVRPTPVAPPHPPKFGYFLHVRRQPEGWIAIITDGSPHEGHSPIEILDMDIFPTQEDAAKWFRHLCPILPWRGSFGDDD